MKLHRLELTGFGPFRDTQTVDFDAFDADGVFLISGRTGAGKSSILDGVSFALYGSVPRYAGGERRLRSDHCGLGDPTEVRLEFTAGGAQWRVTRSPEYERPAKRGGGVTLETARALLEQRVDGEWVGRAAKPRDVGHELDAVLGLNAQQFQQVILLAQNKFSRFLLADVGERQALLRTLFGTRRFETYKADLEQRRRDAQKELDTVGERAQTFLDLAEDLIREHGLAGDGGDRGGERPSDLAGRRDAATTALQRAEYRVEARAADQARADGVAATAVAAHDDLRARADRHAQLAAARARLTDLEARSAAVEADAMSLTRARAAETLRSPMAAEERTVSALAAAREADAAATAAWRAAGETDADPATRIDELTEELARCRDAADAERDLDTRESEATGLAAERATKQDALAEIDARRALVPAARTDLAARRDAARTAAAPTAALQERRAETAARLAAATEAAGLDAQLAAAESVAAVALEESAAAAAAVLALLRRRLTGYAGELARDLVDGQPCAVCGSTAHPRPATAASDAVTDADLDAAERRRDDTAAAEATASAAARSLREGRAAARARAGEHDAETLAGDLARLDVELDAAARAAVDLERLTAEITELDAEDAAAATERERLLTAAAELHARDAALRTTIDGLRGVVVAARGGHASVQERAATLETRRDAARALLRARTALAECERAHAAARDDLDALIAASAFAAAADAAAALRDEDERAGLEARVSTHRAELAAAKERLLELELATAGDAVTPDDVAAAERAVRDADAARTAAIAAARDAHHTAERLRALVTDADDAYARVAQVAERVTVVTGLADTIAGRAPNTMKMDLETFVLAAELEQIVAAANLRLSEMSAGRYTLRHSDARQARGAASGLSLLVLDAHTGRERAPESLSGGETFLASLALALGLAEVVTSRAGGLRLDTLFVDEGFGSLDPDTLELAMRTLDDLRAGGRTVGVISHVEAIKEQVPAQLVVAATGDGPSTVRQDSVSRLGA